jgi:tripartite-type tricarboxylate transporter receptor subunit TctC
LERPARADLNPGKKIGREKPRKNTLLWPFPGPIGRIWGRGQLDLFIATPVYLPLVRTESIKAYAVTSDARMTIAPDIPTFAEMGLLTLSYSSWFGLFAPRGMPKDVIDKLNAAAEEALADPAVRSRLAELGYQVFPREQQTPEALVALVKADAEKWWPITKQFRIKAE